MIEFDFLELLYMRRVVYLRLESLRKMLEKNRRYFRDTDDEILWQVKIGNLETELSSLENAKNRITMQIAKNDFRNNEAGNG